MEQQENATGHHKELDRNHIWHPFDTIKKDHNVLIKKGSGPYLITEDDQQIIDAISSWWVNIHGHSNSYIADAISKQAHELEHVIFAGFSHHPSLNFSQKLLNILPGNLEKLFYSDNGSTAVEVALKMAFQYWHNRNIDRKKIIAIEGAYHGDTFGAMAVGGRNAFNQPFFPFLFDVEYIPFPGKHNEEKVLRQFEKLLESQEIAAFIYEPLIQGASGMKMYPASLLDKLIGKARAYHTLCIADEVMTGFGRTGENFASDHLTENPDIMALSKGITGGFLPMGLTVCTPQVYAPFDTEDVYKVFFHGHSYTANPLACVAAEASLDLLLSDECRQNIDRITARHQEFVEQINHPSFKYKHLIRNAGHLGTIMRIELETRGASSYFSNLKHDLYSFFLKRNVLLRPLGNIIYLLPPYVIEDDDLDYVYNTILEALENYSY